MYFEEKFTVAISLHLDIYYIQQLVSYRVRLNDKRLLCSIILRYLKIDDSNDLVLLYL